MKVTIDGRLVSVSHNDKNIVDIADRANISIPAPCYRADISKGCCKSCIVEINGGKKYACVTKPLDGMNIIINRDDLKKIEKENIKKYKAMIKDTAKRCNCNCSEKTDTCC
ncbi:MAG: 2Fe-2S iron-sulfur cluster-binding protein [Candidatus Kaelpia aquatica]|nr:2Fe-2S iron-sulfur cluster-binding protein [Candidatus Kaelpia aquatica]